MSAVTIPIVIRNFDRPELNVSVEAAIDLSHRLAVLPKSIADQLEIDRDYALFERGEHTSFMSVHICDEAPRVTLSLATLTALLLRIDRVTGDLSEEDSLMLLFL